MSRTYRKERLLEGVWSPIEDGLSHRWVLEHGLCGFDPDGVEFRVVRESPLASYAEQEFGG